MKGHLLIQLAKTERAIAEGLRSLEELNESPRIDQGRKQSIKPDVAEITSLATEAASLCQS